MSSEGFSVLWYKIAFEHYFKKCNYSQLFIMSIKLFYINILILKWDTRKTFFFLECQTSQ